MLRLVLPRVCFTLISMCIFQLADAENTILNRLAHYTQFKIITNLSVLQEIANEAFMEATALINYYGYPAENHTIITDDGYVLTCQRIPYGKDGVNKSRRIPVLLIHGMSCESTQWFNKGKDSFAFVLADAGYDVWLGNFRGGSFSNHLNYSKKSKEYWDYSFEQIAELDLPAMIDYILNITKYSKLLYIGQSMGTSVGFVLLAAKPEYNNKIAGMIAVSPVLLPRYPTSYLADFAKFLKIVTFVNEIRGQYFIFKVDDYTQYLTLGACSIIDPIICDIGFALAGGFNPYSRNQTRLPIYSTQCSAGTSLKNVVHLKQLFDTQKVSRFDYGHFANIQQYGTGTPPEFNLQNIATPIVLFHSPNDAAATPLDVAILRRLLPSVIAVELFPFPMAAHLDFMFAQNAKSLAYDTVIKHMKKFPGVKNTVQFNSVLQ